MFFAGLFADTIPSELVAIMQDKEIPYKLSKDINHLNQYMHELKNKSQNAVTPQNQPQIPAAAGHSQPPTAPQMQVYGQQGQPLPHMNPGMQIPMSHPSAHHQAAQLQPPLFNNTFGHPQVPPMQQGAPTPIMNPPYSPANMAPNGPPQGFAPQGYPGFHGHQPGSNVPTSNQPVINQETANSSAAMSPATHPAAVPHHPEVRNVNIKAELVNEDAETTNGSPVVDSAAGLDRPRGSQETHNLPDIKPIVQNLAASVPNDDDVSIIKCTPARKNRASRQIKLENVAVDYEEEGTVDHSNASEGPAIEEAPGNSNASEEVRIPGAMEDVAVAVPQEDNTVIAGNETNWDHVVQMEFNGPNEEQQDQDAATPFPSSADNILPEAVIAPNDENKENGDHLQAKKDTGNEKLQTTVAVNGREAKNNDKPASDHSDDSIEPDRNGFEERDDSSDDDYKLPYNHRKSMKGLASRKSGRMSKPLLKSKTTKKTSEEKEEDNHDDPKERHPCPDCGQTFSRSRDIRRHKLNVHPTNTENAHSRKRKGSDDDAQVEQKKKKANDEPLTPSDLQ